MGEMSGSLPIPETGDWGKVRKLAEEYVRDKEVREKVDVTEPRFDKAIRDNRDTLKSARLYMANDDGQLAMTRASECDLKGLLEVYGVFTKDINLITEGIEHLEPNEKKQEVKGLVSAIIDALDKDIAEILKANCGCSEKRE
jgi:hypothetical protein